MASQIPPQPAKSWHNTSTSNANGFPEPDELKRVLVDARNIDEWFDRVLLEVSEADYIGFDIETEDSNAHAGIKAFRKGKPAKAFDLRRTKITGFSIYAVPSTTAFYFNLAHADVENRLSFEQVRPILDAKRPEASWVAHNGPFEISNMREVFGYELKNLICSLQMAVSAYGPDEYSPDKLMAAGLGDMAKLIPRAAREFAGYDGSRELTSGQGEIFAQIASKTSVASHSYNGHVRKISHGYGLKKAVESFFKVKMLTFEETLGNKKHMGELTGEETVDYGADDSYWCARLMLDKLIPMIVNQNPDLLTTFFEQENPMIYVYADIRTNGMRVNHENITERRAIEQREAAQLVRKLRAALLNFEFSDELDDRMKRNEKWYTDASREKLRARINEWLEAGDQSDNTSEMALVSGPVTMSLLGRKTTGPNLTYWREMRVILYDLMKCPMIMSGGKVQSDGDARGTIKKKLLKKIAEGEAHWQDAVDVIDLIAKLAGVEQRMKLYLTPYSQLTDPETDRMYPQVSSLLATRRLASSNPNGMQLAKDGESSYVRGFYLGDEDDHLMVSLDWSQIELVLIAELSRDPEFLKAYGQLPYNDLHRVAAAQILSAEWGVELTADQFASLRNMADDVDEPFGFPLMDAEGQRLTPKKAYKYNRGTPGGKGANFGYWYSGALGSVANARGISSDLMWKMTDAYRETFKVAEMWRVGVIADAKQHGFVRLPDGHRRVRLESTEFWGDFMRQQFRIFDVDSLSAFGNLFIKRMQTRSNNQAVNAMIQGSCATLAKRSILRINDEIKEMGLRARFLMPIHDEVLFSVHKDDVIAFLAMARRVMTHHPDIFEATVLHCTAAIGRTFQPFDEKTAPYGQVELDEAPEASFIPSDKINGVLDTEETQRVIDYMMEAA
jgi:DNA polymerase I-like protein with 3'-5' exonuclease and polymerase domains